MSADPLKLAAAQAALEFVPDGEVLGIGTGSTVNLFIDALAAAGLRIAGAVSSSEASSARLRAHGIAVLELNDVLARGQTVPVYVDGADEIDAGMRMIKGGGGALTREKIIAQAAMRFVCIADGSKQVDRLGAFPLPVEVIPMARELVMRRLRESGGNPVHRAGFVTDNGNQIIDVRGLDLGDPVGVEAELEQWPGVVTSGLFARRGADIALLGRASGVLRLEPPGY